MRAFIAMLLVYGMVMANAAFAGSFPSQYMSARNARDRQREASNLSRNAGRNSISRGHHHAHRGHHMGAAGAPMVALGAMQVARGMMGLMASAKAAKLSAQNDTNASNLADLPTGGISTGATELNNSGGSSKSGVALDSTTLHTGELGEATDELHDYFGVTAEDLAGELARGTDPRLIFMNAPINPLSADEANQAMRSALLSEKENLAEDAKSLGSAVTAAVAATPAPQTAKTEAVRSPASAGFKDTSLRDSLRDKLRAAEDDSLSPEIQAALRDQELARQQQNAEPASLFDIVHKKYREHHLSMLPPSTI